MEDLFKEPQKAPPTDNSWDRFLTRFLELIHDDAELHDVTVRLLKGAAEGQEITNARRRLKLRKMEAAEESRSS